MCINDVRQELHTLVHTQGVDGLLHLYRRLEKRGRALLLCLAQAHICKRVRVSGPIRCAKLQHNARGIDRCPDPSFATVRALCFPGRTGG
jgi:hypothetical protein